MAERGVGRSRRPGRHCSLSLRPAAWSVWLRISSRVGGASTFFRVRSCAAGAVLIANRVTPSVAELFAGSALASRAQPPPHGRRPPARAPSNRGRRRGPTRARARGSPPPASPPRPPAKTEPARAPARPAASHRRPHGSQRLPQGPPATARGIAGPPNKGMTQAKPAQAMEPRSLSPAFDGLERIVARHGS